MSQFKSKGGFGRVLRAMTYSFQGIRAALKHEAAFRQEAALACIGTVLAFALPFTAMQRVILLGSMGLVLALELLNSGLEALVDLVSPEPHELAGRAKDMGSAAVFVGLCMAGGAWLVLGVPVVYRLLSGAA